MTTSKKSNRMNKRGEIIILTIGAILLISSIVAGGLYSEKIVSKFRYIGDCNIMTVYDSAKCNVNDIKEEYKVNFEDKEIALSKGYKEADCNFK
jgi:hypothetical protein